MYTECEGIILRQTKTSYGRRMIVLLSDKYGKISAGTSISEKGKNKSSLALRPFTKGHYELYKNSDSFNINAAQTLESYYGIGEDIDKYMAASYVLELTDRMIEENQQIKPMYELLCSFLAALTSRKTAFGTLVIAFQVQALSILGLSMSRNPLLQEESSDKIKVINYLEEHPISSFSNLALQENMEKSLSKYIKKYISSYLGIENLKSEGLMI